MSSVVTGTSTVAFPVSVLSGSLSRDASFFLFTFPLPFFLFRSKFDHVVRCTGENWRRRPVFSVITNVVLGARTPRGHQVVESDSCALIKFHSQCQRPLPRILPCVFLLHEVSSLDMCVCVYVWWQIYYYMQFLQKAKFTVCGCCCSFCAKVTRRKWEWAILHCTRGIATFAHRQRIKDWHERKDKALVCDKYPYDVVRDSLARSSD